MKVLEFESQLEGKDQIHIPPEVAQQIPEGAAVRVILLLGPDDDEGWRKLSLDGFAAAYADEDALYEDLINAPMRTS